MTSIKRWIKGLYVGNLWDLDEQKLKKVRAELKGTEDMKVWRSWPVRKSRRTKSTTQCYYLYALDKLIEMFGQPRWEIPKAAIVEG